MSHNRPAVVGASDERRFQTPCDRCGGVAVTSVACYQGRPHDQCGICADWTTVEAIDEVTYDKDRGLA